jgi:hypothetical protein
MPIVTSAWAVETAALLTASKLATIIEGINFFKVVSCCKKWGDVTHKKSRMPLALV